MKKILVIDDDLHIREIIKYSLEKSGMEAHEAINGLQGLEILKVRDFDLIVLDITMPEMDGLETCREIRKNSQIPILFLSSRDEEIDRVLGLEIGGDDYVTKPFSPRELIARINVILKRTSSSAQLSYNQSNNLSFGAIALDLESHMAYWNSQSINLTVTEFNLLSVFLKYPQKVHTRNNLMNTAYFDNNIVCDRTIDSHIRRLRNKYSEAGAPSIIETIHGLGYKLGICE